MTDDERLLAISDALADRHRGPVLSDAECLSRIRVLVAEPLPSMEWHTCTDGDDYAEAGDDVDLVVTDDSIPGEETGVPFGIEIRFGVDGLRCYEGGFGTRDAAKARAVALYRALKGAE